MQVKTAPKTRMPKEQQCRHFFILVLPIPTGTYPLMIPLTPVLLDHPSFLTPARCPLHPVRIVVVQIHPQGCSAFPETNPMWPVVENVPQSAAVSILQWAFVRSYCKYHMSLCFHCILVVPFQL